MPEEIKDGAVKNLDNYLDFDSEVLRDAIRILFDNCELLQSRIKVLENKVEQLQVEND